MAEPRHRIWAQTDPSLAELHDVDVIASTLAGRVNYSQNGAHPASGCDDEQEPTVADEYIVKARQITTRFKELIGEEVPSDFLALPPFAPNRDKLGRRGVHDAVQLGRVKGGDLVSELGITQGEAARWLRLSELHLRLTEVPPVPGQAPDHAGRDQRATKLMSLLLMRNLDSVETMRQALGDTHLRENLLSEARPWAVVAPGSAEVGTWKMLRGHGAGDLVGCPENLLGTAEPDATEVHP
jgi:hypothetical protein